MRTAEKIAHSRQSRSRLWLDQAERIRLLLHRHERNLAEDASLKARLWYAETS